MRITSFRGFLASLLCCLVASAAVAFLTRAFFEFMFIAATLGIVVLVVLMAHAILNIASRWRRYFWRISMILVLVLASITVYVPSRFL